MAKKKAFPTKPCPKCGHANHARKKECEKCGTAFEMKVKEPTAPKKPGRKPAAATDGSKAKLVSAVETLVAQYGADQIQRAVAFVEGK